MALSPMRFPDSFLFGVATSAHQVEGFNDNDWSEWERAGKLKDPTARSGRGVEHWTRFESDYQLARDVGAKAFRISLEWSRIEPTRGTFDEQAVGNYRERLLKMKEAGLHPVVTLHHFTHPRWFHGQTPWHSEESVAAFTGYARVCARLLEGLGATVLTFNEPMVLLLGGYLQGVMPPGIADGTLTMRAACNLARAHVAARAELRGVDASTRIGIAQNMLAFAPDRIWHPLDRALTHLAGRNFNHAFLEALVEGELRLFMPGLGSARQPLKDGRGSLDFIGINYYTRAHLKFVPKAPFLEFQYRDPLRRGLTDIGWEEYPEGFGQLLAQLKRYRLPVWVTENGLDDREGRRRPGYLYRHWEQLLHSMAAGLDVRGYLHWALMDNFEWLEGYGPRFGLYRVDFETMERFPTPSSAYFRSIAVGRRLLAPPVQPSAAR